MRHFVQLLAYGIEDFLTPKVCAVCERPITPRYQVCRECHEALMSTWIFPGNPGPSEGLPPRCLQDRIYYMDRRLSLFESDKRWQALLHAWKFQNQRFLYKIFLNGLEKILPLLIECKIERIGIVASSASSRNYMPCWDLAKWLARKLQVPAGLDLKKQVQELQSRRGYEDRFWKMHNSLRCDLPDGVLSYLLIEDIYTTGATANEASRMLKQAGARRVIVLSMLLQRSERQVR